MLKLALLSLANRRFTVALTVVSLALSVGLILGVERLRSEARESFTDTVSGIDLIVAARGNSVQILMASVFGVGSTSNTIGWESVEAVSALPEVAWTVPLTHGDNHRGFPVIGTSAEYFERFRYGNRIALSFAEGGVFSNEKGAVIGAEVAARLGYGPGKVIVNTHGASDVAFHRHEDSPFTVSGVLSPTGTPVDRMVFVSLEGYEAMHAETAAQIADPFAKRPTRRLLPPIPGRQSPDEAGNKEAERVNAIYVGLKSKTAVLSLQRYIAEYEHEPLSAVLPALTLVELWTITGVAENTLRAVAVAVVVAGILGMLTMLSATLDARRREFAILRSVGATPARIFGLILLEAGLVTLAGLALGLVLLNLALLAADPVLSARFGLHVAAGLPGARELIIFSGVGAFGLLAGLVPAIRVYRTTLADGLTVRL